MGFDLENTHLDDPRRLQVLLLGIVLTTVWMISLGQWVCDTDQRRLLEPNHKRDYRLFRLGRDYVQRSRIMNWPVPVNFQVTFGH